MGPFNERVRYNAKARQSTAGPSKRRRTASSKDVHDSNAEVVVPRSQEQKEEERRKRLREEVRLMCTTNQILWSERTFSFYQLEQQSETKWSSKKKKRMEKYIVSLFPKPQAPLT